MSYARWSEESDVYVFLSVGGWLECCGCGLQVHGPFMAEKTDAMLEHLAEHRRVGHTVPESCLEQLRANAAYNDAWIKTEREKASDA